MPSGGFATSNAAIERPQAYALNHRSIGIGSSGYNFYIFH